MNDHVYKIIELVGTSETSIEEATEHAIATASSSLEHLHWFEIDQVRGSVKDGKVTHYQVVLKAGFRLNN